MHRLARLSLEHPVAALAWLGALTLVLAAGIPRVVPEYGYRVLIGDDHPAVVELDAFIARYGGGLPIEIAWACGDGAPCADVFDAGSLSMAEDVESALRDAPHVQRVVGPASAPVLVPRDDGFAVRRFVENGRLAPDRAELARHARADPSWRDALVAADGRAGVVTVQPVDSRESTSRAVAGAVFAAIAPHEARGFEFHLVGDPIQNLIVGRDLAESTARLVPFTVLVIGAILYALSRSLVHAAIALGTMGAALAWTFGLLGFVGWPQDGILEVLAPLVLVVGVCDAVHLLSRFEAVRRDDVPGDARARRAARLLRATRDLSAPCLSTSLTTAAAFLSFVTSDLDTFVRFGTIAAFGVAACLVLSFTLLPVLVMLAPEPPPRAARAAATWDVALDAVLRTAERRAVPILATTALLLAACGAGWLVHLRVDHDWTESLGERSAVVRAQRFFEERLGRSSTLEVELALPPGTRVEDPATLARIDAFARWLERRDGLGTARSVVDVVSRVNRLLHADRPAFDRVGDSVEANAQLLELAGFDEPALVEQWLDFERTRTRLSVGAPEQKASTRRALLDAVRAHVARTLPPDWHGLLTGRVRMQAEWIDSVQATQLSSFPTALALVFALVACTLRSLRLAVAAIVPAVVPIVVLLGAMGWLGMSLDVGRAMIAAILLGIAVDDAIHVLRHYAGARRAGTPPREAIRAAVLRVGRAVTTTSVALALGFLTLMISAWQSIASFGFYASIAILGALAATLVVLPACVFALSRGAPAETPEPPRRTQPARRPARAAPVALAVVGVVAIAAVAVAVEGGARRELPCRLLPSGHAFAARVDAGPAGCPLRPFDRVRFIALDGRTEPFTAATDVDALYARRAAAGAPARVALGVVRDGSERRVDVALLVTTPADRVRALAAAGGLAAALLAIPLGLLRRSPSPAATPLVVFYAAMAVAVLCAATHDGAWWSRTTVVALLFAAAALVHLSLVFPEERRSARALPRLSALPYAFASSVAAVPALLLDRSPTLWPSFLWLLAFAFGAAWVTLVASCAYAVRDSVAPRARSRARLAFVGMLLVPALVAAPVGWTAAPTRLVQPFPPALPLGIALLAPLPLGFAVSRHYGFDLGARARRWAARVAYLATAASAIGLGAHVALALGGDAAPRLALLVGAAFAGSLAIEALRRPCLGALEARLAPGAALLRARLADHAAAADDVRTEEAAARLALCALRAGLGAARATILLGDDPRLAEAFEAPDGGAFTAETAAVAAARLRARDASLWALDASDDADEDSLARAGVAVVAALDVDGERQGVVVLGAGPRGAPYGRAELVFVADVAARTAAAIGDARATEARVRAERDDEAARLAVDLMHEVGKDLGWIRRLVDRMSDRRVAAGAPDDGIARVQQLTRSLSGRIARFVRDAGTPAIALPGVARVDPLVDRAVRAASARLGADRIRRTRNATTRGAACRDVVARAISAMIDSAARGAAASEAIRVDATVGRGPTLQITVACAAARTASSAAPCAGLDGARAIAGALGGRLTATLASDGGPRLSLLLEVPTVRPAAERSIA